MATFAFNEFPFGPEFWIEFNDHIWNLLFAKNQVLAFDLKPLLSPSLIVITYFATKFESWLDLSNLVVLNILIMLTDYYIVSDITRNIDTFDGIFFTCIFKIYDIVLFPFLEIIFNVFSIFFSFGMMSSWFLDAIILRIVKLNLVLLVKRLIHLV